MSEIDFGKTIASAGPPIFMEVYGAIGSFRRTSPGYPSKTFRNNSVLSSCRLVTVKTMSVRFFPFQEERLPHLPDVPRPQGHDHHPRPPLFLQERDDFRRLLQIDRVRIRAAQDRAVKRFSVDGRNERGPRRI